MSDTSNTPSEGTPVSPENTSTAPQQTPSPPQERLSDSLNECLQRVQSELSRQGKQLNRSTRLTAIIGTILLLVLTGYFVFGYAQISRILQPDTLVQASIQILEDNLPVARKSLQATIDQSAPTWAEQLSDELVSNLPKIRGQLEDTIIERTEELVNNTAGMTANKFREMLRQHRPALERGFKELSSSEKLSEQTLAELEKALEKELKADIREQARLVLETFMALTTRVQKLARAKGLNEEEKLERSMVMNIKRLQMEQADPSFVGKPAAKATSPGLSEKLETVGKDEGDQKGESQSADKSASTAPTPAKLESDKKNEKKNDQ